MGQQNSLILDKHSQVKNKKIILLIGNKVAAAQSQRQPQSLLLNDFFGLELFSIKNSYGMLFLRRRLDDVPQIDEHPLLFLLGILQVDQRKPLAISAGIPLGAAVAPLLLQRVVAVASSSAVSLGASSLHDALPVRHGREDVEVSHGRDAAEEPLGQGNPVGPAERGRPRQGRFADSLKETTTCGLTAIFMTNSYSLSDICKSSPRNGILE